MQNIYNAVANLVNEFDLAKTALYPTRLQDAALYLHGIRSDIDIGKLKDANTNIGAFVAEVIRAVEYSVPQALCSLRNTTGMTPEEVSLANRIIRIGASFTFDCVRLADQLRKEIVTTLDEKATEYALAICNAADECGEDEFVTVRLHSGITINIPTEQWADSNEELHVWVDSYVDDIDAEGFEEWIESLDVEITEHEGEFTEILGKHNAIGQWSYLDTCWDADAVDACLELDIQLEHFDDAYQGEHGNGSDFAEYIAKECGDMPDNIPAWIKIDWEASWEELSYDYAEHDGHIFRNI